MTSRGVGRRLLIITIIRNLYSAIIPLGGFRGAGTDVGLLGLLSSLSVLCSHKIYQNHWGESGGSPYAPHWELAIPQLAPRQTSESALGCGEEKKGSAAPTPRSKILEPPLPRLSHHQWPKLTPPTFTAWLHPCVR